MRRPEAMLVCFTLLFCGAMGARPTPDEMDLQVDPVTTNSSIPVGSSSLLDGNTEVSDSAGTFPVLKLIGFLTRELQEQYLPSDPDKFCWMASYGRGVGKVLSHCKGGGRLVAGLCYQGKGIVGTIPSCPPEEEQNGALCYPRCRPGYHGVGPVCWAACPPGWVQCALGCAVDQASCLGNVWGQVQAAIPADGAFDIAESIRKAIKQSLGKAVAKAVVGLVGQAAKNAAKAKATEVAGDLPREIMRGLYEGVIKMLSGGTSPDDIEAGLENAAQQNGYGLDADITNALSKDAIEALVGRAKKSFDLSLTESGRIAMFDEFDWSSVDPTGIAAVAKAFMRAICTEDLL